VVDRDVVPAEAPRPRVVAGRLAEDAHVVQARVAAALALELGDPALQLVEHVLQPDDRRHRDVAGTGEPGGNESQRQALLRRAHRRERQPTVVGRRVEPAATLLVGGERPRRELLLLGIERAQEGGGCVSHAPGDLTAPRVHRPGPAHTRRSQIRRLRERRGRNRS